MRPWVAMVRLGALHHFAWRPDVAIALTSAAMVLVLDGSLWSAVAEGRTQIGGLSPSQLTAYVVVAWTASRVCGTRLDDNLGQRVQSGQIATDLLKPFDVASLLLARDLGRALVVAALTGLPLLLLGATLFPLPVPALRVTWLLTGLSVGLGVLVAGQLALLVGVASFRLRRGGGLVSLKEVGVALASGALVPLPAMPAPLGSIAAWLPPAAMAHAPAAVFLELVTGRDVLGVLALQVAWALGLGLVARSAWTSAIHHLTVEGG